MKGITWNWSMDNGQPRVKGTPPEKHGWAFMVGCRNSSNGCASKKQFGVKSHCFLAATWNHSFQCSTSNRWLICSCCVYLVFVSLPHTGANRISFNFRPQLSRRDSISIMPALFITLRSTGRKNTMSFHVSGRGNLGMGGHYTSI